MKKIRKCVIPAAGFWTRFLPATKALPKEMFPLIDKPIMQYLVEEAVNAWIEEIVIITWRSKRAIEDHFDANFELEHILEKKWKDHLLGEVMKPSKLAKIAYVRQPYPKGDWNAILKARPFIWDEPFLVLFWDDIIDNEKSAAAQLIESYERKGSSIIATTRVTDDEVSSYWIIESATCNSWNKTHGVEKFLEKPNKDETESRIWVIGKYVITPDIFDYLEEVSNTKQTGEIRLADAFELMRQNKDIYWLEIEGDRYDTGSKIGFLEATIAYALKRDELKDELSDFIKNLNI